MYKKTNWENRIAEYPNRYKVEKEENSEYYLLTQVPGKVAKNGTPVEASIMNNIEQGIYDNQLFCDEITLLKDNWQFNEEKNCFFYDVIKEDITENTEVNASPDFEAQEILGNIYTDSYNGGFKLYTKEQPEQDVTLSISYQLANIVLGGIEDAG